MTIEDVGRVPLTDADYIALTIWGEARGEPIEGKVAVACVLRNRLRSGRWGQSFESVCLAPYQFSCWNETDPNLPKLQTYADRLVRGVTITDPVFRECQWIADGLIHGVIRPRVANALHYYAASMPTPPYWAKTGTMIGRVAGHLFLEGVE